MCPDNMSGWLWLKDLCIVGTSSGILKFVESTPEHLEHSTYQNHCATFRHLIPNPQQEKECLLQSIDTSISCCAVRDRYIATTLLWAHRRSHTAQQVLHTPCTCAAFMHETTTFNTTYVPRAPLSRIRQHSETRSESVGWTAY